MKTILSIAFVVISFIIINKLSLISFDGIIYLVLIAVLFYSLYIDVKNLNEFKNGNFSKGEIINIKRNNSVDSSDYEVEIKFISRYDNSVYHIKEVLTQIPEDKKVFVIVNKTYPLKSKVFHKPGLWRIAIFILSILFFLYKLLSRY